MLGKCEFLAQKSAHRISASSVAWSPAVSLDHQSAWAGARGGRVPRRMLAEPRVLCLRRPSRRRPGCAPPARSAPGIPRPQLPLRVLSPQSVHVRKQSLPHTYLAGMEKSIFLGFKFYTCFRMCTMRERWYKLHLFLHLVIRHLICKCSSLLCFRC